MANTPVHLTYDSAVTLLKRAVLEKGADHVYEHDGGCRYFTPETGEPECMIGHVLSYKGITLKDIGDLNEDHAVDNLIGAYRWVTVDHPQTTRLLMDAQLHQDETATWGDAVERAITGDSTAEASAS